MLALLTQEQEMLKQTAAQLAATVTLRTPSDLGTVDRSKAWSALAESGLLALRARDEGDPMASGVEVMLVCEALGAALAPVPYTACTVALDLMARAAVPQSWMDGLTSGEVRYGLLMTSDLSSLAVAAAGATAVAVDVDVADYALALGPGPAPAVVRVDMASGFTTADSADLTRPMARVSGDLRIEESGAVLSAQDRAAGDALGLVAVTADMIGVMSSALDRAVEYAKERVQYGVKIGSFQAIQHMCADALTQIEGSASVNRYAAWAVDALAPDEALLAAQVAKAYASSVAREVTETVMQVFGGIGQTWEHIAHVHSRRALVDRALLGDESVHLLRIADVRLPA